MPLLAQQLGGRGGVGVLCNDMFGFWACARWCPWRGFAVPLLARQLSRRSSICVLWGVLLLVCRCMRALVPLARGLHALSKHAAICWLNSRADAAAIVCFVMFITVVSVHAGTGAVCKRFSLYTLSSHAALLLVTQQLHEQMRQRVCALRHWCLSACEDIIYDAACKCSTVGHFPSPVASSAPVQAILPATTGSMPACLGLRFNMLAYGPGPR